MAGVRSQCRHHPAVNLSWTYGYVGPMKAINSTGTSAPPSAPSASTRRLLPWLVAVAFFMESLDTTILNTAVPAIPRAERRAAQHEGGAGQLHPEPGGLYSHQRLDGGPFRDPPRVCVRDRDVHLGLAAVRNFNQHSSAGRLPPAARLRRSHDGAGWPAHSGADFAKSELIRTMSFVSIPALIGPMLGPIAGGLIVGYLHWRVIFFVNIPIGLIGLLMVYLHLPDYREERTYPLDVLGLILFGSGIALLSYVLEVFGEHTLSIARNSGTVGDCRCCSSLATDSMRRAPVSLAAAELVSHPYVPRCGERQFLHAPRHRRRAVSSAAALSGGSRIYSRSNPGLLIMPQAMAAMSIKFLMPRILTRFGYRGVLISNTVILGAASVLVRDHRAPYAGLAHRAAGVLLWAFTSLQYTSMNTLVYADIADEQTSSASSIASTMQQLSISFGVAVAGLVTAFFVPERFRFQTRRK